MAISLLNMNYTTTFPCHTNATTAPKTPKVFKTNWNFDTDDLSL